MSETEQIGKVTLDLSKYPGEDYYCDGTVEDEILTIAKTTAPEDFARVIREKKDWPILYHLSEIRGNIIDWIPFKGNEKVLEIGAGPGAITSRACRLVGKLDCVELSKKRSLINAYRNRDAENVTIHVGNFADIEPTLDTDYDYVLLIGVFEYSKLYIDAEDPFKAELTKILSHVKKDTGRVVIAIENRLGLKYFAGSREDHTGRYFDGIESYEGPEANVRTFSRPALEKIFQSVGATDYHFYYPYPDYKFMSAVYSDKRLPKGAELTENIRNFDRDRLLLFNEKLAYDGIVSDGLYPVFSNSYEIILGPSLDVEYAKYSNDRAPEYRISTGFVLDADGTRKVLKKPADVRAKEHVLHLLTAYEELKKRYEGTGLTICPVKKEEGGGASFPFAQGRSLEELLDEKLLKGDLNGFYELLSRYLEVVGANDSYPAADADMTFANILVDEGGNFTAIDYEWEESKALPAKDLFARAITVYLSADSRRREKVSLKELQQRFDITPAEMEEARKLEKEFQEKVTGGVLSLGAFRAELGEKVIVPGQIIEENPEIEKATMSPEDYQRKQEEKKSGTKGITSVQVYYDRGKGFHEEDSYFAEESYRGEGEITLPIEVKEDVKSLRVDPAICPCFVLVRELTVDGKKAENFAKAMKANGSEGRNGLITFTTHDPALVFDMKKLKKLARVKGAGDHVVSLSLQMCGMPSTMAERI